MTARRGRPVNVAARATFERRRTEIGSEPPPALSKEFYEDDARRRMWNRYRDQVQPAGPAPESFEETGRVIRHFLVPIFQTVVGGAEIAGRWQPPQGWE